MPMKLAAPNYFGSFRFLFQRQPFPSAFTSFHFTLPRNAFLLPLDTPSVQLNAFCVEIISVVFAFFVDLIFFF